MTNKEFLTIKDLAERYGLHSKTVERLEKQGILPPCIRLGKRIKRWKISDLEAFESTEKGAR